MCARLPALLGITGARSRLSICGNKMPTFEPATGGTELDFDDAATLEEAGRGRPLSKNGKVRRRYRYEER